MELRQYGVYSRRYRAVSKWCQPKVINANLMSTGFPSLRYAEERNFIPWKQHCCDKTGLWGSSGKAAPVLTALGLQCSPAQLHSNPLHSTPMLQFCSTPDLHVSYLLTSLLRCLIASNMYNTELLNSFSCKPSFPIIFLISTNGHLSGCLVQKLGVVLNSSLSHSLFSPSASLIWLKLLNWSGILLLFTTWTAITTKIFFPRASELSPRPSLAPL